jgi:hypothetical protein
VIAARPRFQTRAVKPLRSSPPDCNRSTCTSPDLSTQPSAVDAPALMPTYWPSGTRTVHALAGWHCCIPGDRVEAARLPLWDAAALAQLLFRDLAVPASASRPLVPALRPVLPRCREAARRAWWSLQHAAGRENATVPAAVHRAVSVGATRPLRLADRPGVYGHRQTGISPPRQPAAGSRATRPLAGALWRVARRRCLCRPGGTMLGRPISAFRREGSVEATRRHAWGCWA